MRDVTFGITSFERPGLLTNLVRSIRHHYPLAKIVVADNGRQKCALPDTVQRLDLPFDCGLSRARNALIDTLTTKYLLVLEDDFLFTSETSIEPLVEILQSDPEVGAVGGALRSCQGRVAAYALDLEVFRGTLTVREATHRVRFTPSGLSYRLCDMIWNFALFRQEMLAEHRWQDRLKVGEHCPYFHQVKLAGRWRIAACAATRIYHVPEKRPPSYLQYRQRAQSLFESYLKEHGIQRYHRVLPYHFEDDETDKPCVLVLGVGHSGTSVLTRMLHALGWNAADADTAFAESRSVRALNRVAEQTGALPHERAANALEGLAKPWAVKDPRFVKTLHHWLPLFANMDRKPVLLHVRRDRQSTLSSYRRRRAPGDLEQRIDQLRALCQQQYERWPWQRLSVDYEMLAAAVSQFDMGRYHAGMQRPGGELHLPQAMPRQDLTSGSLADSTVLAQSLERDSTMELSAERAAWRAEDGSLHVDAMYDGSMPIESLRDGSMYDGVMRHFS